MLKTMKSLQGAAILNRDALKKIAGGENYNCAFTYMVDTGNGQSQAFGTTTVSGATCQEQMAACRRFADNLAVNTGSRVTFDSGCDGWGH